APRDEVLEPPSDRDLVTRRVRVADGALLGGDLADRRERCAGRVGAAVGETGECARMTGHEELVILTATRRPGERVAADRRGHGPCGGVLGEPRELHACADPALLADPAQVAGETVGEADPGRHAARRPEPLP